jgi:hypothetical protein
VGVARFGGQASISTKRPVAPEPLSRVSALPSISEVTVVESAFVVVLAAVFAVLLDEAVEDVAVEPLVPDAEVVDVVEETFVGEKKLFFVPNPTSDAKTPPIDSVSVLLLAVMTSLPLLLREAVA